MSAACAEYDRSVNNAGAGHLDLNRPGHCGPSEVLGPLLRWKARRRYRAIDGPRTAKKGARIAELPKVHWTESRLPANGCRSGPRSRPCRDCGQLRRRPWCRCRDCGSAAAIHVAGGRIVACHAAGCPSGIGIVSSSAGRNSASVRVIHRPAASLGSRVGIVITIPTVILRDARTVPSLKTQRIIPPQPPMFDT